MAPKSYSPQTSTPFTVYLALSVVLHSLGLLGVVVGTSLWRGDIDDHPSAHLAPLMQAPITIRPLTAAEEHQYLPDAAQPVPPKKPTAPVQKRSRPQDTTSVEPRPQIKGQRTRQAQLAQEQQRAEQAQQAAADRIAALRLRVNQQTAGGDGASRTALRLQRIRLQAYQTVLREQITSAWILPLPLTETRDLHATVLLRVGRTGEITQLQLLQPSGHSAFDASLSRAIRAASPLPALPSDFEGEFLDIELRFHSPDA